MADYGYLKVAYGLTTPAVSVYLDLRRQPADGGHELPLRWRRLRSGLDAAAASEADLRLVDELVAAANQVDRTLVAFARGGRLEYTDELEDLDTADAAVHGPLPYGIPLLRWQLRQVPYVVALVDRVGGELAAYRAQGSPVAERVVIGPDDEIERNAPGGWAQGRYQHRAEDSWAHNAGAVAHALARMAADVGAQVVITAGDVRAVQLLTEQLPPPVRPLVRTVTSGVVYEGSGRPRVRKDTVQAIVRESADQARSRVLAQFAKAGAGKGSVSGVADVVEALRRSAVSRVLVVDQAADERQAWISADPLHLLIGEAAPEESDAQRARLTDAIVRAALAQSAEVSVVGAAEAALADGVGALLRF